MQNSRLIANIWITIFITAFLLSCNRTAQCPLCDRDIHKGMGVTITHNSIPLKTCCMACALAYQHQVKNVDIQAATDFLTNQPLDPHEAVYVVGSDISPCTQDRKVNKFIREPHDTLYACYDRCEPGILAFKSRSDAENFQRSYGGRLRAFADLLTHAPRMGEHHHD